MKIKLIMSTILLNKNKRGKGKLNLPFPLT